MKILTLCANNNKLDASVVEPLHRLGLKVVNLKSVNDKVMHIYCQQGSLSEDLKAFFYKTGMDYAFQAQSTKPKKVFLSDMDATMVVGETIDDMADKLGVGEQVSKITAAAMAGEIDYPQALKERLQLIAGLNKFKIFSIADEAEIAKGAHELMQSIKQNNMYSCLISGGFSIFTKVISKKLGFDMHLSNRLAFDEDDKLLPIWYGDAVTGKVKRETLFMLAAKHEVELEQTVAIGDGANDKFMIEQAGLGIAYYGKPLVRQVANAEIHSGDLSNAAYFINPPSIEG